MSRPTDPGPDDEAGRRLAAAFDAFARASVTDDRMPPPMGAHHVASPRRRTVRWLAPLAAAAAVIVAVAVGLAIGSSPSSHPAALGGSSTAPTGTRNAAASTAAPHTSSSASAAVGTPVHISSPFIGDGSQVGVGMPIVVDLSRSISDARRFAAATVVTVNGAKVSGAWYFERSSAGAGRQVEGHYRLRNFWPAHAAIRLDLPVRGVSAGRGLVFANDLTVAFHTGDANIATVDNAKHRLTLTSDGRRMMSVPVSLGRAATPTLRGTKVVMEKGQSICMSGPGYNECDIKYTQRLTDDGEYLHAAPWNQRNILHGVNSSNGCTNLLTADALKLYRLMEVGDVVEYPDATGPMMTAGDGLGDWNVPWSTWRTGGLYPTN